MSFHLNPLYIPGLSVTMTSLSNSRQPTRAKVWIKYTRLRKVGRQVLVLSLSQVTCGKCILFPYCYICSLLGLVFFGSMVANLRVAEKFEKSHLSSPEVAPLVESVKFYYMDGYFLTHGVESALELSSKSAAAGKVISYSISTTISD